MEYQEEFIIDFARRTRANLHHIQTAVQMDKDVYEFTQLVNSLLGLLVFPREHYFGTIPNTPLSVLVQQGWPEIRPTFGQLQEETLPQLLRMLRNGVAHCNLEFLADNNQELQRLRVWNCKSGGRKTWEVEMSRDDLRTLAYKFIELLEEQQNPKSH